jgi:hypothetical protein
MDSKKDWGVCAEGMSALSNIHMYFEYCAMENYGIFYMNWGTRNLGTLLSIVLIFW